MSSNKEQHSNKVIWKVILVLSIVIATCSAIYIFLLFNGNDYSKIGRKPTTFQTEVPADNNVTDTQTKEYLPENPIDFEKLSDINTDIYAWIEIPNTTIDYAIVQSGAEHDDFFYLNHNIECNYEFAGSIYSEKQTSKDFSDPVTLIYGHNMLNGTMFADLHKFADSEFFKNNDTFYIYTPGHKFTYRIYSAYVYDNRHILNSFDFSKKDELKEYFESTTNPISMNKNVRKGIKLKLTDKVVTLSTCTKDGNKSTRYLVQGVLINDEKTR